MAAEQARLRMTVDVTVPRDLAERMAEKCRSPWTLSEEPLWDELNENIVAGVATIDAAVSVSVLGEDPR